MVGRSASRDAEERRRSQKRGVEIKVKEFDEELIKGIRQVNNDSPFRQECGTHITD